VGDRDPYFDPNAFEDDQRRGVSSGTSGKDRHSVLRRRGLSFRHSEYFSGARASAWPGARPSVPIATYIPEDATSWGHRFGFLDLKCWTYAPRQSQRIPVR
jgi:hypothetical protein